MNNNLVALKSNIESLKLKYYSTSEIVTKLDDLLNFFVEIKTKTKTIILMHGYDMKGDRLKHSESIVTLSLCDTDLDPSSYVVYMTEGNDKDYAWNVEESQRIINDFLNGKYQIQKKRHKFSKQYKFSILFSNPDLVYKYATESKSSE